ncbi:hypothetical protein [Nocardia gipuzkoensis]
MTTSPIELLATCRTSAGDVTPLMASEVSPLAIEDRIRAIADTDWSGIGLAQEDLRVLRDRIGFAALREMIAVAGPRYSEVELLTDWWKTGEKRAASDDGRELLFESAEQLGAVHIKIGTAFGTALESTDPLVIPLRELADDAARRGSAARAGADAVLDDLERADGCRSRAGRGSAQLRGAGGQLARLPGRYLRRRAARLAHRRHPVRVELDDGVGSLFEDTRDRRLLCGQGSFDLTGLVRAIADLMERFVGRGDYLRLVARTGTEGGIGTGPANRKRGNRTGAALTDPCGSGQDLGDHAVVEMRRSRLRWSRLVVDDADFGVRLLHGTTL